MLQLPSSDLGTILSDVIRLATVIGWGIVAYFFRDVYREFKDLRNDVHGKNGINERLARIEGAQGAHHYD